MSRKRCAGCIFCLKALAVNVPRLDRHLDCSGWEEGWRVFVVAWVSLLIPRNLGHAKHNLAVTAKIAMFGCSEKPHKCHWLELNWSGKRHAWLRHPLLQLRGEESEPILGSLRKTHCPNEEGAVLIFLLLSDVRWAGQAFYSDAQKHPPELPAVLKLFWIVLFSVYPWAVGRKINPVSHAASARILNSTWDSAELRAGGSYFGSQCYRVFYWVNGKVFCRCIWAVNTFCCQRHRKFLEVMRRNSKTVVV